MTTLPQPSPSPRLVKFIFKAAGVYGVFVMLMLLFFPARAIGESPLPHPDIYFGFVTVTLTWQFIFLLIAADPVRYRPLMPIAVCEKWFYVVAIGVLLAQHRVPSRVIGPAVIDAILGAAFILCFRLTRPAYSVK